MEATIGLGMMSGWENLALGKGEAMRIYQESGHKPDAALQIARKFCPAEEQAGILPDEHLSGQA